MCRWIVAVCVLVFMLPATALAAGAQQAHLVREYVVAMNTKDETKLRNLTHPRCLGCINSETRDYYDDYFSRELQETIPDDYKLNRIISIDREAPLMGAGYFSYPVRPSHWMQIDFNKGPHDSVSILRQIVKHEDAWVIVVPCPTPQAVKRFYEGKAAEKVRKARVKVLNQELKDPLLSELKELIDSGKKIQAMKRYRAKTGESLSIAKDVIFQIEQ